jgi:undecaprenyl-diphosphatase
MNLFQALILGLIQGITEFIPVSSSAHLVLVPWVLAWPAPGLAFDTMAHWGTLTAVLVYFWRDWRAIARGFVHSLGARGGVSSEPGGRLADPDSRLAWWIIIATIPAAAAGYLFEGFFENLFHSPAAVGGFLLLTALVMSLSEWLSRGVRELAAARWPDAVIVGLAQAVAIAPGLSRSGTTIAAGMARGLTRESSARFSFLLSAPVILGAGLLKLLDLAQAGGLTSELPMLLVGFLAAAVAGYLCIRFLMAYLRRGELYVFSVYCAVLGIAVLIASAMA